MDTDLIRHLEARLVSAESAARSIGIRPTLFRTPQLTAIELPRLFEVDRRFLQEFTFRTTSTARARSPIRREDLATLAEYGWYLDPELPVGAAAELARALREEEPDRVSEELAHHFQGRVDEIEATLAASFPSRENVLSDAFEAHREGKFNLSIPVFIAQADGMCHERLDFLLFIGKEREKGIEEIVKSSDSDMRSQLVGLFGAPIPLLSSKKDRGTGFSELNRHLVLHGESVSYGTQQNSLKVISFLSYLNFVLAGEGEPQPRQRYA